MKKVLILFLILFLTVTEHSNADNRPKLAIGLQFRKNTFSEALNLAKKENKLIFLYFNTTWCGPCIELKMTTFRSKAVAELYNSSFINISLNGEKGDGPALVNKYRVRGYPSYIFINSEGNVVYMTDGFLNSKRFTELGEKISAIHQKKRRIKV
jgi:thioredoxin-related protein